MPVTRIKNNQITDATVNLGTKAVNFSLTAGKIANNLTYGSSLTITGDLVVNGTTTTINSTTATITDPIVELNEGDYKKIIDTLGRIGSKKYNPYWRSKKI